MKGAVGAGPSGPPWQVSLLGHARVGGPGAAALPLERRAAALLAYLALEGETPRPRLAALLYPDAGPATARNNLVHLLRRLRRAVAGDLVGGERTLTLAPDVALDVRAGPDAGPEPGGVLLADLDFSDLPDLEDWVVAWRERLTAAWRLALARRASGAERDGAFGAALEATERLLDLDPLSEEAWRALMRLHARQGDRSAALAAYGRCREALRRELGGEPHPDTTALAHAIGAGTAFPAARSGPARLPLSVLRPPVMVGREREWARIGAALGAGQPVELIGEAGIGKSRLLQELVRASGHGWYFACRPGDAGELYGSTVRFLRGLLAGLPGLPLAPWVRRELARLLPELGEEPLPITGDEERTRFFQAQAQVLRAAAERGVTLFAWDDTHRMDPASREALPAVWGLLDPADVPVRVLWASRPAEPGSGPEHPVLRLPNAVTLHLGPLDPGAVGALLAGLDVPELAGHARALERAAGGHPQFLLETVRRLLETGQLRDGLPGHLPPPEEAGVVIARRLAGLSPAALHTARAAAVLQGDGRPELVAEVLGVSLLDLAVTWEELEAAQIMHGERFTHDLVEEAVLAGLPGATRGLLHRSAARTLERHGADPARVARHWEEGGDGQRAAEGYLRAAGGAKGAYRFPEAAAWSERAADLLVAAGETGRAFGALAQAAEHLRELTLNARLRDVARRLEALAVTPHERARALAAWIHPLLEDGELDDLVGVARRGIDAAQDVNDGGLEARFLEALAGVFLLRGELEAARGPLEALLALGVSLPDPVVEATAREGLGLAWAPGDPARAAEHYDEAARIHRAGGDRLGEASVLNKRAPLLFALGDAAGALEAAEGAAERLSGVDGATNLKLINAHERFLAAFAQEEYCRGLEALREGLAHGEAQAAGWGGVLQADLALLRARLGDPGGARAALEEALACEKVPENKRHVVLLARAHVLSLLGEDARGAARALTRHGERLGLPLVRVGALVTQAAVSPPADALSLLGSALSLAEAHGFQGLRRAALTRRAAAHLARDEVEAARTDVERALLLSSAWSLQVSPAEVRRTHAEVLEAARDPRAPAARDAYIRHVRETARLWVPPEEAQGYLQAMLGPPAED